MFLEVFSLNLISLDYRGRYTFSKYEGAARLAHGRRGKIEIMMDILDKASAGVNKTGIVYGANLNFDMAGRYLPLLMKRGLIVRFDGEKGIVYRVTERGREVLKNYKEIKKFV